MKNLLITSFLLGMIIFAGCQKANPISPIPDKEILSLQKNNPDPRVQSFSASFQLSGSFSSNLSTSVLEISGTDLLNENNPLNLFSSSKINITTKAQTGSLVITNSKGDKISGLITGTVQLSGNDIYLSGTYSLSSGTGNYKGTTGNGNYSGKFNKNLSTGNLKLNGVFYLPGIIQIDRFSE